MKTGGVGPFLSEHLRLRLVQHKAEVHSSEIGQDSRSHLAAHLASLFDFSSVPHQLVR